MRWWMAIVAVVLASAAQAQPHMPTPLEDRASQGLALVMRQDCNEAAAALQSIYDDPGFSQFDPHLRAAVLEGADVCLAQLGRNQEAYDLSQRAIREPAATSLAWGLHTDLALNLTRPADALSSLLTLSKRSPELFAGIREETIVAAYAQADMVPESDARKLELLEAIDHAGWAPQDPFADLTQLKMERLRLLLAAGRTTEAKTLAAALTNPEALIALRIDARYAALAETARTIDVAAATRRELTAALLLAGRKPDWLSGAFRIAQLRMRLGDNEGALRTLQSALDGYRDLGDSAFTDGEHLREIQAMKGEALERLGRLDQADGAFAEAAADAAPGESAAAGEGFAERLAYASYLIDTDRSALALDLLTGVKTDTLTDGGKAAIAALRACAYAVTGDRAAMARQLVIAKSPALPDYIALINGLVCAGDLDGVADIYVKRLKDPSKRTDALLALQRYRPHALHGDEAKAWDAAYRTALARPAIAAAVTAAGGHIEDFDIFDLDAL